MTSLQTLRHELGDHIASELSIAHAPLGSQLNPPAVVVRHGIPYVTASTYCTDFVQFEAIVVAPPGDPAAVADALDDLVDQVRDALQGATSQGYRYGFREVSEPIVYGDKDWPAVVVIVGTERDV